MLNYLPSFVDEMRKLASDGQSAIKTSGKLNEFKEGAGAEAGPATDAVLGAGIAKAYGIDPLAGSAAGYGLGSLPGIVKALAKRKLAYHVSEYSGPLSYGPFKQESYIPPFNNPPVKTAGPPPEKVKKAERVQGMVPTGTQTMGPQIQFSPTKQLNAARSVAKIEPTKPTGKGAFGLSIKLPTVGSAV